MVATCALVACPWGVSIPSMPLMIPFWVAHSMAFSTQADTLLPLAQLARELNLPQPRGEGRRFSVILNHRGRAMALDL